MKLNKTLLIAALSLFAASGIMAKPQAKEEIPGVAAQPASFFYTGKPYDADLGAYTFNFRNYDPAVARWTSTDPSGFPDGANNRIYAPNVLTEVDPYGLKTFTRTVLKGWYYINEGTSVSGFGAANFAVSIAASLTTSGIASKIASTVTGVAGLSTAAGGSEKLTLISSATSDSDWNSDPTGLKFKLLEISVKYKQ